MTFGRRSADADRTRPVVPFGPALDSEWRVSELGILTERLEQRLILELAEPVARRRVLDIGCGDGALSLELERRGAAVVGLDASWPMLEAARARAAGSRTELALSARKPGGRHPDEPADR